MVGSDYTSNAHFVIAEDTVMGLFDQVTGMMGVAMQVNSKSSLHGLMNKAAFRRFLNGFAKRVSLMLSPPG